MGFSLRGRPLIVCCWVSFSIVAFRLLYIQECSMFMVFPCTAQKSWAILHLFPLAVEIEMLTNNFRRNMRNSETKENSNDDIQPCPRTPIFSPIFIILSHFRKRTRQANEMLTLSRMQLLVVKLCFFSFLPRSWQEKIVACSMAREASCRIAMKERVTIFILSLNSYRDNKEKVQKS